MGLRAIYIFISKKLLFTCKIQTMSKLILYHNEVKILDINLRIKKSSYEKIKSIKSWYNSIKKPRQNTKELIDIILDDFIINNHLEYINVDNTKKELKGLEYTLKYYRIDSNFNPSISEKIEAVKQFFENKNEKKTTNEIIEYCLSILIDIHPEVNDILDKNKLIKQKNEIDKAMKNKQMEVAQGRMLY